MTEKDNTPRRALWHREQVVWDEITRWRVFMMEARAVGKAIDEWRQLDTKTCSPLPSDTENE